MAAQSARGAVYISPHSADVILSDIRPVKFELDALSFLNAILDEFLANVILSAQSLSTDRLKSGLLRVLPTPLGKEALLEAELELRAYWERTKAPSTPVSANGHGDGRFNVQWAVELLRLKCEAYSTLNDSDEDPNAEKKLNERLGSPELGCSSALVAPAALYMTAILECICEHILSNVGRVATRDSSRTVAGIPDLFTALCEDDSMYALFRSLHVYDRIELLSKSNRPRRNKSISSQAPSNDHTGSPSQDPSSVPSRRESPFTQTSSFDSSSAGLSSAPISGPFGNGQQQHHQQHQQQQQQSSSRSSLEKVRNNIKLFNKSHGRSSSDRADNVVSPDPLQPRRPGPDQASYDPAARKSSVSGHSDALYDVSSVSQESEREQEFEDLVRSAGTMKMSLTPDRLRTMESPKPSSRNGGSGIRQTPHIGAAPTRDDLLSSPAVPPLPTTPIPLATPARAASVRTKRSHATIREDEEGRDTAAFGGNNNNSFGAKRKNEMPPPPAPLGPSSASGPIRSRSISTSGAYASKAATLPVRQAFTSSSSSSASPVRSATTSPSSSFSQQQQQQQLQRGFASPPQQQRTMDEFGMPKRTRKIQRNRESMDLDDIMNGSGDEGEGAAESMGSGTGTKPPPPRTPSTPGRKPGGYVSQSARDLIAFLDDGPPVDPYANRPPPSSVTISSTATTTTTSKNGSNGKGSSRLQRMISKLSLSADKESENNSPIRRNMSGSLSMPTTPSTTKPMPVPPPLPIATVPVPPRIPTTPQNLISPPESPVEDYATTDRSRKASSARKAVPAFEGANANRNAGSPSPSPQIPSSRLASRQASLSVSGAPPSPYSVNGNVNGSGSGLPMPAPSQMNGRPRMAPPSPQPSQQSQQQPTASLQGSPLPSPQPVVLAAAPPRKSSARRSPPPPAQTQTQVKGIAEELAVDMRRMMGHATSAEECRLLVDMFMARAGIGMADRSSSSPASSSSSESSASSDEKEKEERELEREIVELFLGEVDGSSSSPSSSSVMDAAVAPHARSVVQQDVHGHNQGQGQSQGQTLLVPHTPGGPNDEAYHTPMSSPMPSAGSNAGTGAGVVHTPSPVSAAGGGRFVAVGA